MTATTSSCPHLGWLDRQDGRTCPDCHKRPPGQRPPGQWPHPSHRYGLTCPTCDPHR